MRSSQIEIIRRRCELPDETRVMEQGKCEGGRIGGLTVGRAIYEPGWRWSAHVGPTVGAKPCTGAHVGVGVSGTATAALDDGRVCELRAGELIDMPQIPHESWVVGNEPSVSLHVLGADHSAKSPPHCALQRTAVLAPRPLRLETVTAGSRRMSPPGGRHTPEDGHFMRRALRQAEIALSTGQTPCGAVILDGDGQCIGEGHNTVRAERDPTAHGEVVAMREAWRRVGDRQRRRGGTVYSTIEPCLLCAFVITQFGFRRVVFAARGTDVPTYKPLLGADLVEAAAWVNAQPDWAPLAVVGDFMRERSVELITAFPWTQTNPNAASETSTGRGEAYPRPRSPTLAARAPGTLVRSSAGAAAYGVCYAPQSQTTHREGVVTSGHAL